MCFVVVVVCLLFCLFGWLVGVFWCFIFFFAVVVVIVVVVAVVDEARK